MVLRLEHSAPVDDFLLRLRVSFALIPPLLHLPTSFSSFPNRHARPPGVGPRHPRSGVQWGRLCGLNITVMSFTVIRLRRPRDITSSCSHPRIRYNAVSHIHP